MTTPHSSSPLEGGHQFGRISADANTLFGSGSRRLYPVVTHDEPVLSDGGEISLPNEGTETLPVAEQSILDYEEVTLSVPESSIEDPIAANWLQRHRAAGATIVAAAGLALAFEQSPLNEALRTNVGLRILEDSHSAVAVGLAIYAITNAIEFGTGALITLGLHSENGAVQKLKDRMAAKSKDKLDEVQQEESQASHLSRLASTGADVSIALGIGAGLVTVRHHINDENPTIARDLITTAKATQMVAVPSAAIGYLAGGGIEYADGTILQTPAEKFVEYGTNNLVWLGIFATGFGVYKLKNFIKNRRQSHQEDGTMTIDELAALDFGEPSKT